MSVSIPERVRRAHELIAAAIEATNEVAPGVGYSVNVALVRAELAVAELRDLLSDLGVVMATVEDQSPIPAENERSRRLTVEERVA